jgi:hypothetical protein
MACHDANGAEAAHVGEHVHSGLDGPLRALVHSGNQHYGSNPFGWLAPALIPVQHLHRMKTLPSRRPAKSQKASCLPPFTRLDDIGDSNQKNERSVITFCFQPTEIIDGFDIAHRSSAFEAQENR